MASPSAWTLVPDASAWKPVAGASPAPATTGSVVGDFLAGVGGNFAQHAVNAYDLLRKIPGADRILPDSTEFHKAIADATPDNTPSHVGKFVEGAEEYMLPAGRVGRATEAAPLLGKMAAQGVTAGAVRTVQGGTPGEIADTAALGAAGPVIGAGIGAAASAIKNSGAGQAIAAAMPDVVGIASPRLGNALRVASKVAKATLPERVAQVSEAAEQEAGLLDDLSTALNGKNFKAQTADTQKYIRDLSARGQTRPAIRAVRPAVPSAPAAPVAAPEPTPAPAQQAAPPPQAAPQGPINTFVPSGPVRPPLAASPTFANASPAPAANVGAIPDNATPQQLGRFPAQQAAEWLARRNGQFGPYDTAAGNELVPDKARSLSLAEQLRDEMLRTGNAGPEHLLPPGEATDLKTGLRDLMREVPKGAHKSVADANYAGNQDPETAGAVYEAAARADKSVKLAEALRKGGIPSADAVRMDASHWEMLSKSLGLKSPSKDSIAETLFRLRRLEAAAKPTTGAIQ